MVACGKTQLELSAWRFVAMRLLRNKHQHLNNPLAIFATCFSNRAVGVKPEPKTFRWWTRNLKFGFQFHRDSLFGQAAYTNNTMLFMIFWTKLFWSRRHKLSDVGAGVENLRHLEPGPEIWLSPPQPCSASKGADTSELQSHHSMTPAQWTWLLCSSVIPENSGNSKAWPEWAMDPRFLLGNPQFFS